MHLKINKFNSNSDCSKIKIPFGTGVAHKYFCKIESNLTSYKHI